MADDPKPPNKGWANLKPAQPGEVRNPKGKPKGTKNRATILQKYLEATFKDGDGKTMPQPFGMEGDPLTVEEAIDVGLIVKAIGGDVAAAREIKDTIHGKIRDEVQIIPPDVTKKEVDEMTDEEAVAAYDAIAKG